MRSCTGMVAIVADDHEMFRNALAGFIRQDFEFDDVVQVGSFVEALQVLNERPSVSLISLDLGMPTMDGTRSIRAVRSAFPDARVAVITASEHRDVILSLLQAGVHGFIPKTLGIREIRAALQRILAGEIFVPPTLSMAPDDMLPSSPRISEGTSSQQHKLSPRQKEVFDLISLGKSNKEIAIKLGLSEGTVKVHVNALFRALGAHNRVGAILRMAQTRSE